MNITGSAECSKTTIHALFVRQNLRPVSFRTKAAIRKYVSKEYRQIARCNGKQSRSGNRLLCTAFTDDKVFFLLYLLYEY